jgi:predicted RNA-binding Zn ribbon-like protein
MEPGGRQPAPGALALVQAFVNTVDLEDGPEQLTTPAQLHAWLVARELLDSSARLEAPDLRRALELREALRELLLANNAGTPDKWALATLNRIAGQACLLLRFQPDGQAQLEPGGSGIDAALGRLLAIVYMAMIEGNWGRLKACRNDVCRWAFYDASKNQHSAWCSMAICGSRVKARAYRQRHARQAH